MGIPKFISAKDAVKLVKSGDTICVVGFVSMGHPEELTYELEKSFMETGQPKDLTLTYAAGQGDGQNMVGCNRFAHEGFIKRVIASHFSLQPDLGRLIAENKVEAYAFPFGPLTHAYRAKAGQKPCIVTPVGLRTFVDPRETGGKLNLLTVENGPDYVSLIEIDGEEYLMYKTFSIDICFIRGTTADENGNITMEKEALILEQAEAAYATKASGGIVIAQVETIAKAGTLHPKDVKVPGIAVDYVVQCSDPFKFNPQSYAQYHDPSISGERKIPLTATSKQTKLDDRKIACRRAAFELVPHAITNVGIGIPDGLAAVETEENLSGVKILYLESGPIGGVPCAGVEFGGGINSDATMAVALQLDFMDGGSLELAILGCAELDAYGNVNVSKFGPKVPGPGGFIDLSQNTKKVVFLGTFTAGGLKVKASDGKLTIVNEGKTKKLISLVEHKTFSGEYAKNTGQEVIYITERAVFEMRPEGLTLTEIAPGIDLQTQVLDQMEFMPIIAEDLKLMDERIFREQPMGIYEEIMSKKS